MTLAVGDRVMYSATWLRSVGQYSGPMPHARGIIVNIKRAGPIHLAVIDWDKHNGLVPDRVNIANLEKARG